jgi:tRNA(Arg) A34 adenosine deaminase TadA
VSDEEFMRLAFAKVREGIEKGQLPFGAVIASGDQVISSAYNTIYEDTSIISHAETNAIADACHRTGRIDLSGCTLYATCEPCPMCFGACVLANISRLVYSARLGDGIIPGFSMLTIANDELKSAGNARIEVVGDCLREEGIRLFELWIRHSMKNSSV